MSPETSASLRERRIAFGIFAFVLLVCFFQFKKSVDFTAYVETSGRIVASRFKEIAYPQGVARWGDFFQSPIVVLAFSPLAHVPLFAAKLIAALLSTLGILWCARMLAPQGMKPSHAIFLLCLFTHALSDVYLSGNINFAVLVLCVVGWFGLHSPRAAPRILGALALSFAVWIKLQPIVFIAFFALTGRMRAAVLAFGGIVFWLAVSYVLMPSGEFLRWWAAWFEAIRLYPTVAGLETPSFQSPPAILFRWMEGLGLFDHARRHGIAMAFASGIQGLCVLLAVTAWWLRKEHSARFSLAVLLGAFFLGGPFSWALTALCIVPLVHWGTEDRIPWIAWVAAIVYAATPKAAWPVELWLKIAYVSVPGICLLVVALCGFIRLWRGLGFECGGSRTRKSLASASG